MSVLTRGVQVATTSKAVSPRLDEIFKINVPEVVRLFSVSDPRMMKLREGLSANARAQAVETMKPRFSEGGVLELTVALSRMNITKIRDKLDEEVGSKYDY
ncbi:hypothetical protein PHMEG_00031048 [Phytophthora megakarya]|uniref:Uncharacterized protein n=1 Tax=Phytophthora megakarya TaxID=4795 RepID=A0A225UZ75_9STRA|nr:hypothetical protein PHMEG_00031048 [Phytophthora megakarya]